MEVFDELIVDIDLRYCREMDMHLLDDIAIEELTTAAMLLPYHTLLLLYSCSPDSPKRGRSVGIKPTFHKEHILLIFGVGSADEGMIIDDNTT